MMEEPKKKGFWGGLFRSRSSAQRAGRLEKDPPRRSSAGDAHDVRRGGGSPRRLGSRRRPRRPEPQIIKGKDREGANGHVYGPGVLTEWPPSGMPSDEELTLGHAMEYISHGVPAHKGHKHLIPHTSEDHYMLYATSAGNKGETVDSVNLHDSMTQLMTLKIHGSKHPTYPWETLEQPSYAFGIGVRPGTVTLNHWASNFSNIPPLIALRDPGMTARDVDLAQIFTRLKELEGGLEDDNDDLLYKNLYRRFLKDPDKMLNPHKTLDKQITDLIMVLSKPDWIDFSNPRNHVVTRFIFDTGHGNHQQYLKFFHQLLLSSELDLRINSKHHQEHAKEKLMSSIPPRIQWSLALSRRWRDNIRIEAYGRTAEDVKFRSKLKRRQVKMLKRFAQMMKWPNLTETLDELKYKDREALLDSVSSYAMAFFTGLVLPGPSFPFLIMNSLIDIDPDPATDDLALISHLHPNCGFQYRNSYTYWSSTCIVGKVLAPTCLEIAGWVGPARPTVDLGRSQIARIRSRKPRQRMTPEDIASMSDRSDPLGPPAQVFPVKEYQLLTPDTDDIVDTVRIEQLMLRQLSSNEGQGPKWFDASMQFAIDGISWPLRLQHDVSFIAAWPCSEGPHPLFFDYVYRAIKADEIISIRDWGTVYGRYEPDRALSARSTPVAGMSSNNPASRSVHWHKPAPVDTSNSDDAEKVLVVEAFGVRDNEVLTRAWCAHWGLSAIVADVGRTCMACAIREAYAATLTVVILVDDQQDNGGDD